jgi:hypothetical protein
MNQVVEAGGVGLFRGIENRQLIENAASAKRTNRQKSGKLERIWNTV